MLSDHQHGSSAGRSKMLLGRENLFHPKAIEQPHPCRGTAEQMASEQQGPENKAGKRQNYSPHTFLRCCSWLVLVKDSQKPLWCQKAAHVIVKDIKWISWECQAQNVPPVRQNLHALLALSCIMKYYCLLHRRINQTHSHLFGFLYWNSLCTLHDFRFEEYFCSFTLPSTEDCKTYTTWKSFLFHILQKILRTFQNGIEIIMKRFF